MSLVLVNLKCKIWIARFSSAEISLNDPVGAEGNVIEMIDTIADTSHSEDHLIDKYDCNLRVESLNKALSKLNDREQDIIKNRKLLDQPMTLDALSKKYGISCERVRQIESKAFEKLRADLTDN